MWSQVTLAFVATGLLAQVPPFRIRKDGSPADFDLKLQYRISGGSSGIQYRSVELPKVAKWVIKDYQANIDAEQMYTGQVYEERGRTFLALRGMGRSESSSRHGYGDEDRSAGSRPSEHRCQRGAAGNLFLGSK